MKDSKPSLALYIHWPFCKSKCPYCDFNSHVQDTVDYDRWRKAFENNIAHYAQRLQSNSIRSIFFGGGTPSLMPPALVEAILNAINHYSDVSGSIEITLEGNPTSFEASKYRDFKSAGINRISLGVQSLNDDALTFLGREHSASEALHAVKSASSLFDNYSFDLIYALPEQTVSQWKKELESALTFVQGHMSLYQLTIEKGTPFFQAHRQRHFIIPEDDEAAVLYEATQEVLEKRGLPAYETSNHAREGEECRHNLAYWHYEDYLGIGPGAHSRISTSKREKEALMMIHAPQQWLEKVEETGNGIQSRQLLTAEERLQEKLLMGIRLKQGISKADIACELSAAPCPLSEPKIRHLQQEGLLESSETHLIPSTTGRLLINQIVGYLIDG